MALINLHSHTYFSDGVDSLLDMALEAKKLGHSAYVVTDHEDEIGASFGFQRSVLLSLQDKGELDFPVIIGSEIRTPVEECLLFGSQVIKRYYKNLPLLTAAYKETNDISLWCHLFRKYVLNTTSRHGGRSIGLGYRTPKSQAPSPYAMVMCHPRFLTEWKRTLTLDINDKDIPQEYWDLLCGYEIQNSTQRFDTISDFMKSKIGPDCKELINSDAHMVDMLNVCCNETEKEIINEEQLIRWLNPMVYYPKASVPAVVDNVE